LFWKLSLEYFYGGNWNLYSYPRIVGAYEVIWNIIYVFVI